MYAYVKTGGPPKLKPSRKGFHLAAASLASNLCLRGLLLQQPMHKQLTGTQMRMCRGNALASIMTTFTGKLRCHFSDLVTSKCHSFRPHSPHPAPNIFRYPCNSKEDPSGMERRLISVGFTSADTPSSRWLFSAKTWQWVWVLRWSLLVVGHKMQKCNSQT